MLNYHSIKIIVKHTSASSLFSLLFNSSTLYSQLQLVFRTTTLHGLIFMNARLKDALSDQLLVGLYDGKLKIVFTLEGHSVTTETDYFYNDDKNHTLIITRYGIPVFFIYF